MDLELNCLCGGFEHLQHKICYAYRPRRSTVLDSVMDDECHIPLVARRYSKEERRKKIERYKRKKIQRNFSKKVKYACRKTFADSRPRVRGRFAKHPHGLSSESRYEARWVEDEDVWSTFLEAFSNNFTPLT